MAAVLWCTGGAQRRPSRSLPSACFLPGLPSHRVYAIVLEITSEEFFSRVKKVGGATNPLQNVHRWERKRRCRCPLRLRLRPTVWGGAVRRLQGTGAPLHPLPPRCPVHGTTGAAGSCREARGCRQGSQPCHASQPIRSPGRRSSQSRPPRQPAAGGRRRARMQLWDAAACGPATSCSSVQRHAASHRTATAHIPHRTLRLTCAAAIS